MCRKVFFALSVALLLAGLAARPAAALPFHDCQGYPEVHAEHGNGSCGNSDGEGETHYEQCSSGCDGAWCNFWESLLNCYLGSGSNRGCTYSGTIRCSNGLHRDYAGFRVNTNGTWPDVSLGPNSASVDNSPVCDCSMSPYSGSSGNCSSPY